MPISGYQTNKEIDCSNLCFDIKPTDISVEPVRRKNVRGSTRFEHVHSECSSTKHFVKKFDHLSHMNFPELVPNNISLIIGIDNLDLIQYKQI